MTVLFTEEYTVTRAGIGAHVKGKYVKGTDTVFQIDAHWQPLSGKELLNLTELQRTRRSVRVYSETEIKGLDTVTKTPADLIEIEGTQYEVQKVKHWKESELCAHYAAIAVEVNQ